MKFFGLSYRPRLRTVLIAANVFVLLLPIGSIYLFRIYENELIRQTETELYVQGAAMAAMFRNRLQEEAQGAVQDLGVPLFVDSDGEYYHPIDPHLDLARDPILPPQGNALDTSRFPAPSFQDAGLALQPVLVDTQRISLAGIRITDPQGVIVSSTGMDTGLSLAHTLEFLTARTGKAGAYLRMRITDTPAPPLASISRGNSVRVFATVPILSRDGDTTRFLGAVILNRTPRSLLKAMYAKRDFFIMAGLVLVATALVLALFISYMLTRPINALIRQVRRMAAGDFSARTPPRHQGTREVEELTQAFHQMARDIETRTTYIRDFASHVSHEFKTPLTSIRGALELLQDHAGTMQEEQRTRFLANMAKDTDRLHRLVSRLLELARADVYTPGQAGCDPDGLFQALAGRYAERGLSVEISGRPGLRLAMEREALDAVLSNLLDNSLSHGAKRAALSISRERGEGRDAARIQVDDNGQGISPANRDKVFTPFFTTRRTSGGTGLGLSIARSLLEAHRGAITLSESTLGGTCFSLTVPLEAIAEEERSA